MSGSPSQRPSLSSRRFNIWGQPRMLMPFLLAPILVSVAVFAIVAYLHFDDRVLAYQLIDDPAPFMGLEWYTGLLSHTGVLLWCAAASVCAFAGMLLRSSGERARQRQAKLLLILAGANLLMALDDLFLLHEEIGEKLFGYESRHTGEAMVLSVYAVLMIIGYTRFRATIAETETLLLAAAFISFGASVAIDIVLQLDMGGNNIFLDAVLSRSWGGPVIDITEEILKLNGILLWFLYLFRFGYFGVQDAMSPAPAFAGGSPPARTQSTKRRKPARR